MILFALVLLHDESIGKCNKTWENTLVQYDLISILFPMLMRHRLSLGPVFLFHWDVVRLPRMRRDTLDRKIPLRSKVFLEWRVCSFLSIDSCLVEHIVSNHSGNKADVQSYGHMDSSPSKQDHLSVGLLPFYTWLYWLTGARQYKITLRNKSWISFLIGFVS